MLSYPDHEDFLDIGRDLEHETRVAAYAAQPKRWSFTDKPDERQIAHIAAMHEADDAFGDSLTNGPTAQRGGMFQGESCRSLPERAL